MKILIVSYSYLPKAEPRAFRWGAIAELWAAQGHHVEVVSAWEKGLPRSEVLGGVHVHRVGQPLTGRIQHTTRIDERLETAPARRADGRLFRLLRAVHRQTWKKLKWPDFACLWTASGVMKARERIAQTTFDRVITVSHPFTDHLVGLALKRSYGLPWIVDIGDPFSFLTSYPLNNHRLYHDLNHQAEQAVLGHADAISVTNEATRREYMKRFSVRPERIRVIPPLLAAPEELRRLVDKAGEKLVMVYVGTLYRNIRSPEFLLRLFERVCQSDLRDRVDLHFYGHVNDCAPLFEAPTLGPLLNKSLFVHGMVDQKTVWEEIMRADILVNIGNRTSWQLPSKVVEYAFTAKPILNLVSSMEDSSHLFFHDYPAVLSLVEGEPSDATIDRLVEFLRQPPVTDVEEIRAWVRQFRVEGIAAAYDTLL